MPRDSDKVLFEIFKETTYNHRYEVVYYTELDEKNRDYWINRAINGESFVSGFIPGERIAESKAEVEAMLDELNNGVRLTAAEVEQRLKVLAAVSH